MPASGAPARARRVWQEAIGAVLMGVALTTLLTYPTVKDFGRLGRFDSGDGRFSVWNVAWVAHALVDDPRHLLDANIFYPHPRALTYSELNLVAGVFAAPVYALTRNPAAAHNGAVVAGLVLAFVAMFALVRRLTGSFAAGIAAATGYTFGAYTSSHTAEIQLLMLFGFPLIMLAFDRIVERPSAARGAWLGAALAFTALACGYYGVFAGGLIAVAVLWWMQPSRAYWKAIAVAVLVLGVLVLPVVLPYYRARSEVDAVRLPTVGLLRAYSANWRDYLTSATWLDETALHGLGRIQRAAMPHLTVPPANEVLFAGGAICGLALVGMASIVRASGERRTLVGYAMLGGLALWASFGPDAGLYSVVLKVLPGSTLLRAPVRLGIISVFAACVLAGFGVRALARTRSWLAMLCTGLVVAECWVPWPLRAMTPPEQPYRLLATLPRAGVVEFPFPYLPLDFHQHTRAMVRSMVNWQPLLNGYSDFIPPDFKELAVPVNGFPDPASFAILRQHDVRYVIVRLSDYSVPEYRQKLLDRFPSYQQHLRLVSEDQDVRLYEIVSWP